MGAPSITSSRVQACPSAGPASPPCPASLPGVLSPALDGSGFFCPTFSVCFFLCLFPSSPLLALSVSVRFLPDSSGGWEPPRPPPIVPQSSSLGRNPFTYLQPVCCQRQQLPPVPPPLHPAHATASHFSLWSTPPSYFHLANCPLIHSLTFPHPSLFLAALPASTCRRKN